MHLPLSVIKCKLFYENITSKSEDYENKNSISAEKNRHIHFQMPDLSAEDMKKMATQIYDAIKKYKKTYGSIVLVDVVSSDGTKVKITV